MNHKQLQEYKIIKQMVRVYCEKNHHTKDYLCEDCQKLVEYSQLRIINCPHKENKKFCSGCKTHCYKKEMKQKIKTVMKFSGPRMILYNPLIVIKHMFFTLKNKIGD